MPPSLHTDLRATLALAFSLALSSCTLAVPEARPAERPAPRAPAVPAARAARCMDERVQRVLAASNQERARRGRAELDADSRLQLAAQRHAEDMARGDFMDHEGSDGSDVGERAEEVDYDWTAIAENVAAGQPDPETVLRSWMESAGHRDNILAGDVRHAGIGYAYRADARLRHYWVMVFGETEEPTVPPRSCG